MSRKKMIALFVVAGLAGLALIGASMDFGGGLVVSEATRAVKEMLGADLTVEGISGNPIKGYATGRIGLVKDGENLFSAGFLRVKINLMSLLSKSPKLSVVSVGGVEADADALAAQISRIEFGEGGGGEIPVETVHLVDSVVTSRWAKISVKDLGLSFSGKEIGADVDVLINDVPVKGRTVVLLDGSLVDVKSLAMTAGKGAVSASGRVAPDLSVSGALKDLDLAELLAFWPDAPSDGVDGRVSANFRGEGEWNLPSLSGDLDYSGKSVLGYPVDSVKAKWDFAADKLSVTGLDARVMGIPLSGAMSAAFAPGKVPVLDLDMAGSGIKLEELKKLYPEMGDYTGEIEKFTVKLSGAADALNGVVEFSAPSLGAFGLSVANSAAQIKINPKEATLSAKSVFEGAPVTAQGTITDYAASPKLNLSANIRSLNLAKIQAAAPELKDLPLSGSVNGDVTVKGTAAAPDITGKVWSDKLTAMKETIEAPSVAFGLKGGQVNITGASAKWRGASLSGSGTVGADGKLNIKAALENLQPDAIAPFYPDIAQYKIKGAVTAGVTVTGTAKAPKIDLSLTSGSLGLMDAVTFKNIKVATVLAGDLKALDKADLDLDISAAEASAGGVGLSNLAVKLKKAGQKVNIASASVNSGKGSIAGTGALTLPEKKGGEGEVDFTAKISGADLDFLAKSAGVAVPVRGTVDGTVTVKGPLSNPSLTVKAASPKVSASGFAVTDVALGLSGNAKEVKIEEFGAKFGGGLLGATGTVKLGDVPDATVDISGKDLDLAALTAGMPDAKEFGLGGKLNVNFKGRFAGASGKGEGAITSPSLTVMGIKATNLNYPLALEGNKLSGKGGSLVLYGGKASGEGSIDIATLKYSHSAEFSGVDVNALLQDFTGGLGGKVTGLARGSANVSGALAPKFSLSGKGSAHIGEGAVSGFTGLDLVTKLHGVNGVRYTEVTAPFRLETGKIILEKGTRATAPKDDPLYKFLAAEGGVGPRGALNLSCTGNVNMQIINALTGGAIGGLAAGGSVEDILKGALGGAQKGMEHADFRDISLKVGGTVNKPSVSDLKVAPGAQKPQEEKPAETKPQVEQPKPKTPEQAILEQIVRPGVKEEKPGETKPQVEQPKPKTPEQAILEQIIKPGGKEEEAPPAEGGEEPKPAEPKKPEDVIKEKILESIFKK